MTHPLDCLNPHEEGTQECSYCGYPSSNGAYCSSECELADYKENCLD